MSLPRWSLCQQVTSEHYPVSHENLLGVDLELYRSKNLIIEAGLPLGSVDALPRIKNGPKGQRESLDVAFDGADEVDDELNLIKGGGACLFQEKLVALAAKKFVCVAGKEFYRDFSLLRY